MFLLSNIKSLILNNRIFRILYFVFLSQTSLTEWYLKPLLTRVLGTKDCSFNILDAGCGFGQYSYFIMKKFPYAKITCIDIDNIRLESTKKILSQFGNNINFINMAINDLNLENTFDFILCSDVLEHIENDEMAMNKLNKSLKKNGLLVLGVPAKPQKRLLSILKFNKFFSVEAFHHAREGYSKNEITSLLTKTKFQVSEYINYFGFFGILSYEILFILQLNKIIFIIFFPIFLIFISPLIYLLMCLDKIRRINKGNGILLTAKKVIKSQFDEN